MSKASDCLDFYGRARGLFFGERQNRRIGALVSYNDKKPGLMLDAKTLPPATALAFAHWILDVFGEEEKA